jgi:hypothetical protein
MTYQAFPRNITAPQMVATHSCSRHFSATVSSDFQGVNFGDLLTCLDMQYGLSSRFIQEPLSELAHILGYVRLAADTMIDFSDAKILMEEMGVPPMSAQQIDEVKQMNAPDEFTALEHQELMEWAQHEMPSEADPELDAEPEDLRLEYLQPPADLTDRIHISKKTKLFRRC